MYKSINFFIKESSSNIKLAYSKKVEENLIEFLHKNQNPPDSKVHAWAKKRGYEVDDVEEAIYKLATRFVRFWKGGRSNEKGITVKDVDSKELRAGIKIEYEHTPDKEVAQKISLDHLAEFGDYYLGEHGLVAMEKLLEKDKNARK